MKENLKQKLSVIEALNGITPTIRKCKGMAKKVSVSINDPQTELLTLRKEQTSRKFFHFTKQVIRLLKATKQLKLVSLSKDKEKNSEKISRLKGIELESSLFYICDNYFNEFLKEKCDLPQEQPVYPILLEMINKDKIKIQNLVTTFQESVKKIYHITAVTSDEKSQDDENKIKKQKVLATSSMFMGSLHEEDKDKKKKNRPGQAARRALWEQKFGENAKHLKQLKLKKGQSKPVPFIPQKIQTQIKLEQKKELEGPLHPSWIAKQKQKEMMKAVEFKGTKIVFD